QQIRGQRESIHAEFDRAGDFTRSDHGFERKRLFRAYSGVVARDYGARVEDLFEHGNDICLDGVHALAESLDDESVTIPVDDEAWQQVAFGMNHAVGFGVVNNALSKLLGRTDTPQKEIAADLFYLPGQQAQGNL